MNPISYEAVVIEPPLADWPAHQWQPQTDLIQSLRTNARRRIVESARRFTQRLATISEASGFDVSGQTPLPLLDGDPDNRPLIVTGHQPVIFHSGLTYKYETTEQFAAAHQAIAIALVIDTDEGDAGEFPAPQLLRSRTTEPDGHQANHVNGVAADVEARQNSLSTRHSSFAAEPAMLGLSQMKPHEDLQSVIDVVHSGLLACHCSETAATFANYASRFSGVSTSSAMEANLIVRRSAGIGARMLEVRFSEACGFPEALQLFTRILAKPLKYASCCNQLLNKFRADNRIRNEANPFPNLKITDEACELPFWMIDLKKGTRTIPVVQKNPGGAPVLQTAEGPICELIPGHEAEAAFSLWIAGTPLIPRGPLITATLRLLFSDLFVHGTGGGRYDRFTDLLIREWWQEEVSPFAVASASRFLFEDFRTSLGQMDSIASQLRDLQFNPQRYLDRGIFPKTLEADLKQLISQKDAAVEQLKRARAAGESAEDAGRTIQQVSDEIRQCVASEFATLMKRREQVSPATIETVRNRKWPWFFFPSNHAPH